MESSGRLLMHSLFRDRKKDAKQTVKLDNNEDSKRYLDHVLLGFYKSASIEDITRQHTHVVTASGEAAAVA